MEPVLDDRWSAESFEDYSIRTSEVWEKEGEEFRINTRSSGFHDNSISHLSAHQRAVTGE